MTCKHCDYRTIGDEVMALRRGDMGVLDDLRDRAVGCAPITSSNGYTGVLSILATGDVFSRSGKAYPESFPAFRFCPMCGEPIPDLGDWADDDCREAAEARGEAEGVEADWCIVYGTGHDWLDRDDDGYRESTVYVGEDGGNDGIQKIIANYHFSVDRDDETTYRVKRFKVVESYDVQPIVRLERV